LLTIDITNMGEGLKELLKKIEFMHGSAHEYTADLVQKLDQMCDTLVVHTNSLIQLRLRMDEVKTQLQLGMPECASQEGFEDDDTFLLHQEEDVHERED